MIAIRSFYIDHEKVETTPASSSIIYMNIIATLVVYLDHEDVEATPASSMIASSSLASVQDTTQDIMNHDQGI